MGANGSSAGAYNGNGHASAHGNGNGNGISHSSGNGYGLAATSGRISDHPMGTTAVESVQAKRRAEPAPVTTSASAGRVTGNSAAAQLYAGMASADEYNAATAGGSRSQKRKVEEAVVGSKRRKKGCALASSFQ